MHPPFSNLYAIYIPVGLESPIRTNAKREQVSLKTWNMKNITQRKHLPFGVVIKSDIQTPNTFHPRASTGGIDPNIGNWSDITHVD